MEKNFSCPCCYAEDWMDIKKYHYEKNPRQNTSGNTSSYLTKRRYVLFNLWFSGDTTVTLTAIFCKNCGFVCYTPRPTEEDIQRKYQYLAAQGEIGTLSDFSERGLKLDYQRGQFMYDTIARHHQLDSASVLDIGGGDGRLLRPFLEKGYDCNVVDFNLVPADGIKRLGATLEDLPDGTSFDILICSHVLEHVVHPGHFLRQLKKVLAPGGVIYIETPFEVWDGIPIQKDPVTHLNFFSQHSLNNALLINELLPLVIETKLSSYDGIFKRVIRTVCGASETVKQYMDIKSDTTRKLLFPNFHKKLSRKFENLGPLYKRHSPGNLLS
ncbi:MAG: class I SAM-dependent methyltransferase [Ginsengibacter sp.]